MQCHVSKSICRAILTKIGVFSLVEEDLLANLLHDDVPRVERPTAAHQRGEDGVSCEHVALRLGELFEET